MACDVIDFLVRLALGIEPALDDLNAVKIRTDGVFESRYEKSW
jgi:hypothetical protein